MLAEVQSKSFSQRFTSCGVISAQSGLGLNLAQLGFHCVGCAGIVPYPEFQLPRYNPGPGENQIASLQRI